MAAKCSDDSIIVDHPLTEKEIDERAKGDTPYFKLSMPAEENEPQALFISTDNNDLHFPAKHVQENTSVIMVLKKYEEHGYAVSNCVLQGTYLKVVQDGPKSKRVVKFVDSEQYKSQLFKLRKDPRSETKFALYTSALDSKGHNKIYYLTPHRSKFTFFSFIPKSGPGTIVAEESSSPDGYYHFSMSKAILPGSTQTTECIGEQSHQKSKPSTNSIEHDKGTTTQTNLVHNTDSFIAKAKSTDTRFWLKRPSDSSNHPSGGHFIAKENKDWYFTPCPYDDKKWPLDKEVVLKIVYHDITSEEEKTLTGETFYFTIESTLIPDHYLDINLEQPTQEGNYPVQFISKTKVKWYRKEDNQSGTQFSIFTLLKDKRYFCFLSDEQITAASEEFRVLASEEFTVTASESDKFMVTVSEEVSVTVSEEVRVTVSEENRVTLTSEVTRNVTGPWSPTQIATSINNGDTNFLMRFPSLSNQEAYVSTADYTLGFRGIPTNPEDLSVILVIGNASNGRFNLSSKVFGSDHQLKVELNRVFVGNQLVNFAEDNIEWEILPRSDEQETDLAFRQTLARIRQEYYLLPVEPSGSNRISTSMVVGVADNPVQDYPINIYGLLD